jgi:hypothetical protein
MYYSYGFFLSIIASMASITGRISGAEQISASKQDLSNFSSTGTHKHSHVHHSSKHKDMKDGYDMVTRWWWKLWQ